MGCKLSAIEYYLPEQTLTNDDLEKEFEDWSADKIEKKVGIRERHIVGREETALDLAYRAANKLFQYFDKSKIDFVLFCTQSPDYYLPTSACILQDRLGLNVEIGAVDFNLGCSGFVYGLAFAKGLITAGVAHNVLLLTAETYTKHINSKDKANRTIFGDGAAAAVIEEAAENHIFEFVLGTDGSGWDKLIVPNGGLRHRYDAGEIVETDESGSSRSANDLFMNGPEIFNFTIEAVPKLVAATLKKNQTWINELDYIIFHQANSYIIEYLRKKIGIPSDKFYMDMTYTGNTVSCTIPIAIKESFNKKMIKHGDNILIVGFGVGYSYGATVIKF